MNDTLRSECSGPHAPGLTPPPVRFNNETRHDRNTMSSFRQRIWTGAKKTTVLTRRSQCPG